MKKVRKAIIPAAGLGTRFVPVTKTVPKELLPIVDRPLILYIVEEIVRAGIEDIIFVSGRGKHAIEDFFDVSYELEDQLEKTGKTELLEKIKNLPNMANFISIRQKQALGLGHAVYCGKPIVGDEPFAVLLGDEIMISGSEEKSVTQELVDAYKDSGISTVSVMKVAPSEVSKYGIVKCEGLSDVLWRIDSVVEKPAIDKAPSQYALPGRYTFNSNLFRYLENLPPGRNGEIQLTDAMTILAGKDGLHGRSFTARRYDAGDKFDFVRANIELGLEHPEVQERLRVYLKEKAATL